MADRSARAARRGRAHSSSFLEGKKSVGKRTVGGMDQFSVMVSMSAKVVSRAEMDILDGGEVEVLCVRNLL
jgi:hypothetical protein